MVDPITAAATAASAFKVIKAGFSVGRDIEQMAGDLSRWMGALSDLDEAERLAKNPPIFTRLFAGQSAEAEAMQVFAARRKAQEDRDPSDLHPVHNGPKRVGRACGDRGAHPQAAAGNPLQTG